MNPIQIAREQLGDCRAIAKDGKTFIVWLAGYLPFEDFPIDAYYLTSQRVFLAGKQLVKRLAGRGFEAQICQDRSFKRLATEVGLVEFFGLNSLGYAKGLGSRFCIGVVEVEGEWADSTVRGRFAVCDRCEKCVSGCPVGAINPKSGLDPSRCIRAYMENTPIPDWAKPAMKGKVLGCDVCQRACPHNAHLPFAPVPPELEQAFSHLPHNPKKLAPLIGSNYARKSIVSKNFEQSEG